MKFLRSTILATSIAMSLGLAGCGGGDSAPEVKPPVVLQPAAIVAQPSAQSVTAGERATFTVNATGSDITFQWQRNGDDVPGATSATLTLNSVQLADNDTRWSVVVKNASSSVVSDSVRLTVKPVPGAPGLSLVAGQIGGKGFMDGAVGRFEMTGGIAIDPSGVLYVLDRFLRTVTLVKGGDAVVATVGSIESFQTSSAWESMPRIFDAEGNSYHNSPSAIYKVAPGGKAVLLAGHATETGAVDGTGTAARFSPNLRRGIAIGSDGTLYVIGEYSVRKITRTGEVSTLAGSHIQSGFVDGAGANARFQSLWSITVDGSNNVYVGDAYTIRKITAAGVVTTIAGSQYEYGMSDGPGVTARFLRITGMAADKKGNIFVTDNCAVRKVAPDGMTTTIAGKINEGGSADGNGLTARFCVGGEEGKVHSPVFDSAGNLYVADSGNATIRKISPEGFVSTVAGRARFTGGADGVGAAATFAGPRRNVTHLNLDAQRNIYVSEMSEDVSKGRRLRKIDKSGTVSTINLPAGYSLAGQKGELIASVNGTLNRVEANGSLTYLAGKAGEGGEIDGVGAEARISSPIGLMLDGAGNYYWRQENPWSITGALGLVRKMTPQGQVTTLALSPEHELLGWTVDLAGNVFLLEKPYRENLIVIRKLAPSGERTAVSTEALSKEPGQITAVTVDAKGNIYVAEYRSIYTRAMPGTEIRKYSPDGTSKVILGQFGTAGVRFGAAGRLNEVESMVVDDDGVLYLMSENAVLRFVQ